MIFCECCILSSFSKWPFKSSYFCCNNLIFLSLLRRSEISLGTTKGFMPPPFANFAARVPCRLEDLKLWTATLLIQIQLGGKGVAIAVCLQMLQILFLFFEADGQLCQAFRFWTDFRDRNVLHREIRGEYHWKKNVQHFTTFLLVIWQLFQSSGWGLITTHCCPTFLPSKKNSNSTQFIELYFGISEQIKPLQPIGQAAEFKFESKCLPAPVVWQSLPRTIREENRRIWLQNQWPSSWGRAPAQLGRVGRASTNTGRFRVSCSRCGPRQARLRKTYYHSCDTDLVRELKSF